MNRNAGGFKFRDMANLLVAEPTAGIRQAHEGALVETGHVDAAVRIQTLQPMDPPNFRTRVNIKKRKHVVRVSSGDHNQSCASVAHDLLQRERYTWIGERLVAIDMEWRERSVVIEQQCRLRCPSDSTQKRHQFRFDF
jgi:hypothetical protein